MAISRKTSFALCLASAALFGACGDDDNGGTPDAATGGADARPADGGAGMTFNVTLTKAEEVPVCASAGANATGMATVTIAADGSSIQVSNFTYSGLSGNATMAHIHFGAIGAMGGVVLPFTSVTSPINQTFTSANYTAPAGAPVTWDAFVAAARQGMSYLNVHTQACGPGEIRGQID
jgi:hypothetical protein